MPNSEQTTDALNVTHAPATAPAYAHAHTRVHVHVHVDIFALALDQYAQRRKKSLPSVHNSPALGSAPRKRPPIRDCFVDTRRERGKKDLYITYSILYIKGETGARTFCFPRIFFFAPARRTLPALGVAPSLAPCRQTNKSTARSLRIRRREPAVSESRSFVERAPPPQPVLPV